MADKRSRIVAAVAIIVALVALGGTIWGMSQGQSGEKGFSPQALYECLVYREQGCAKFVAQSGGAIEIQSGGALAITPGATVANGAAGTYSGNNTFSGDNTFSGINTFSNHVKITGPTAAATATPAAVVDNLGAGNVLLSVRKAATPQFSVYNDGTINGKVLRYGAASGQAMVCGSTSITGTGTLPTTLSTPVYVQLALAQDVTGDCARLSYTNSAATVTAKCWNTALTPAAAATVAVVNWCAVGTP